MPVKIIVPPVCCDSYRAGMLNGLGRSWNPADACRLGAVLGAIKIAYSGPQNHPVSMDAAAEIFEQAFGKPLPRGETPAGAANLRARAIIGGHDANHSGGHDQEPGFSACLGLAVCHDCASSRTAAAART